VKTRHFGTFLLVAGLAAIALFAWSELDRYWYQQQHSSAFHENSVSPQDEEIIVRPAKTQPVDPALIGRLVIPTLDLNVLIREGIDRKTLRRAAGHVPNTALPGQSGNVVLAAHRDTFFRPLRNIQEGDEIRVITAEGAIRYQVNELMVVNPDYVSALEPTTQPTITLITCYPFDYVGPAPKRFIVRATQAPAAQASSPRYAR